MIKNYWEKWEKLAEKIGDFQFNLIFSFLYYCLVVPTGLIMNVFNDFLKLKDFPRWEEINNQSATIKELKSQ